MGSRSNSIINVSIIGDAKKLIGAVQTADAATGGLVQSAAKVLIAGKVVTKGFDLVNDSLREADRRGDAIQRLERSIGKIDTAKLSDVASDFTAIGASGQDMLELEAIYADLAVSAGLAAPEISATATGLAESALAAAQVYDADPSQIIEAIGKAVGGQTRGIKEYGVDLTEAAVAQEAMRMTGKDLPKQLTDTELAAARVNLILAAFNPLVKTAADGSGDFAQQQDELGAKFEDVSGKIGEHLEGPLGGLLDWISDMVDAIPAALDGWGMLGDAIVDAARFMLGPLGQVADVLRNIISLFDNGQRAFQVSTGRAPRTGPGGGSTDRSISDAQRRQQERNGLGT